MRGRAERNKVSYTFENREERGKRETNDDGNGGGVTWEYHGGRWRISPCRENENRSDAAKIRRKEIQNQKERNQSRGNDLTLKTWRQSTAIP